jgi:hypothetical protein
MRQPLYRHLSTESTVDDDYEIELRDQYTFTDDELT